jgi:hypothetical protein
MKLIIIPLVMIGLLLGCARPQPKTTTIDPGMSKAQVEDRIGSPNSTELIDGVEFWNYDSWDIDPWWGFRTNQKTTTVKFVNGAVVSYGRREMVK